MNTKTPIHNTQALTLTHQAYIGIASAAKLIGVSRSTMYRMIEAGAVQVYRPTPHTPRLSKDELLTYVEQTAQI